MTTVVTDVLLNEYAALVATAGARDELIVGALVRDAAWTEEGAAEVLWLAQRYGTSILRNALALASAMDIEDGDSGL